MKSLYFIAITPNPKLSKEVSDLKKRMATMYYSKAALSSPPHITLFPPFTWENEEKILNTLDVFVRGIKPFSILLNGFGCFGIRTIYINLEHSGELMQLQKNLSVQLQTSINLYDEQNNRPYHPHMTIATRDLKKEYFNAAWEEFQKQF